MQISSIFDNNNNGGVHPKLSTFFNAILIDFQDELFISNIPTGNKWIPNSLVKLHIEEGFSQTLWL